MTGAIVGSMGAAGRSAAIEEEKKRSEWELFLFQVGRYLKAPAHFLVYEGVRWSKLSLQNAPFATCCATIRLIALSILACIPALVGSFFAFWVQREALRLQEGLGFSHMGSLDADLPEQLRVLSLNICTFPGNWNAFFGGIETSGRDRIERLIELFEKKKADVICLQEVFDPAFALELRDRLRAAGWGIACYNPGLEAYMPLSSGLFVASRLPISEARYIPFEPWGYLPRGAMQLKVGSLDLIVTHLTPSRDDLSPAKAEIMKRQAEIAIIAQHLRKGPTLLLGDINAQKNEVQSIGSLKDVSPKGMTCTEQFNLDVGARLNGLSRAKEVSSTAIDRVFANRLDIETAIVPSYNSVRDSNPLSDHHALIVQLTTPQSSST